MNSLRICGRSLAVLLTLGVVLGPARAEAPADSFAEVSKQVNKKMVKLFGAGGFRGLVSYGSGVLVSSDGYILTVSGHLLDTQDLSIHLYDGRRLHARVVVAEPELDAALLKLNEKVDDLDYFDLARAGAMPHAQAGDWVLAFSNQFKIATRDEPMSVQRGVIAAYTKLRAQRGVHEAPYTGDVYVIDAITNNPGAGGGAITTRKGELLGLIGKELRNTLTDTWINYAVPVNAKLEIKDGDKVTTIDLAKFVEEAKKGTYKPRPKPKYAGRGSYTGIVLVPNVIERTPPYIEDVVPDSPAARAGLKPDDLIVYIDGEQVQSIKVYNDILDKVGPETTLTLEVRRVDREQKTDKLVTIKMKVERQAAKVPPKK